MIAIDPQRPDIDLEAVLMTIVWLENLATGQADVSNAEFSVVTRLPFTLDIEQSSSLDVHIDQLLSLGCRKHNIQHPAGLAVT